MKKVFYFDIETDGYKAPHYKSVFDMELSGEFHELIESSISKIFNRKVTITECQLARDTFNDKHGEIYRNYLRKRKGEQFVRITWAVHRDENVWETIDPLIWKWLSENELTPGINHQVSNYYGLNRDGIVYTDLFKFIPPHLLLAHNVGII